MQHVIRGNMKLPVQLRLVAYNITNLRILWEIKSDGVVAHNYSASSEASTDKGVINLKSDIIEKYWESTDCTDEWVQFDAGFGKTISLDTFAAIGHNLTSSAIVTLYGYGDGGTAAPGSWAAVSPYAVIEMSDDPDEDKLIWVAPTLPQTTYRHWRLRIQDATNSLGRIRIGRIVAGSSLIFNGENCLDDIELTPKNFKDEKKLNGYTGISNNRAYKSGLSLSFRNLDRISATNYRLLKRYINYCRDSLKALVIVDPSSEQSKYQFKAFAKLSSVPREQHKFVSSQNSYTSMSLEYDEAR